MSRDELMSEKRSNTKIVVAGAGLMGTGIADAFSASGYRTLMVDLHEQALRRTRNNTEQIFATGVSISEMAHTDADDNLRRPSHTTSLAEAAEQANLLVAPVSESLDIKTAIISEAEPLLAATAIMATNPSALSVTQIAAAAR